MESTDDCPPHGIPRPDYVIEHTARKEETMRGITLADICLIVIAVCSVLITLKLY